MVNIEHSIKQRLLNDDISIPQMITIRVYYKP